MFRTILKRFRNASRELFSGKLSHELHQMKLEKSSLDLNNFYLKNATGKDALTGAQNRHSQQETFIAEIKTAARENEHFAMILFDLDFFKKVNDTFGHPAGDAVLKETAKRVQEAIRQTDKFFRHGGEEFLLFLRVKEPKDALDLAARLRETISADPVIHGSLAIPVTASFGVVTTRVEPEHFMTKGVKAESFGLVMEQMIEKCDRALYDAKEKGRNRVVNAGEVVLSLPQRRMGQQPTQHSMKPPTLN